MPPKATVSADCTDLNWIETEVLDMRKDSRLTVYYVKLRYSRPETVINVEHTFGCNTHVSQDGRDAARTPSVDQESSKVLNSVVLYKSH
jgi:hypothetical protein